MRTVIVRRYGGPEVLEVAEVDTPQPAAGEVRIAVAAAGVNPVDLAVRDGAFRPMIGEPFPFGFGWDVAGEIDAVGDGVTGFAAGDPVVALLDKFAQPSGTHASHVVVRADAVASAPAGVAPVAAATLPLNALTADQALDLIGLEAGAALVVTGAAGGVGDYVVQLAARRGLRVLAVASERDAEAVRAAGATDFVARTDDLPAAVRALVADGADGLVDAAQLGAAGLGAVRDRGSWVSVTDPSEPSPERGIRVSTVHVHADGARLAELARGVEQGWLGTRVAATYPLDAAAEAHALVAKGGLRGRVVLVP